MKNVGFIGLGTMGASFATNLQNAGFQLIVHDARKEAAAPHLARQARWADTPKAVAEASEVVLTSLPGPPEINAVALDGGTDGLDVVWQARPAPPAELRCIAQDSAR